MEGGLLSLLLVISRSIPPVNPNRILLHADERGLSFTVAFSSSTVPFRATLFLATIADSMKQVGHF
ncbi:hypothetical protein QQP08_023244 [Theobroma cacao]|nr:hypothetical protein QQP08_023244 [Theobroma cacao]